MFWPCDTSTSTCRSFATISSGVYLFFGIAVLLHVKRHSSARTTFQGEDHLDQQCPGDARHLIGKRHRHDLEWFAGEKLREPGILLRLLPRELQHRMGSDHQNASQIAIALFRDRTELLLAAGRILPRD